MPESIFYTDQYVKVRAAYVSVSYDLSPERYDIRDIESVKLSAVRSKDWLKLPLIGIALNLAGLIVILLSINLGGIWDIARFFALVTLFPVNVYLSKRFQNAIQWTLTLQTASGPVDILTSTDGVYLSRVKRAINKALKARSSAPQAV